MLRVETVGVKEMARDLLVLGDGHMAKDLQKSLLAAAKPIVGDVRTAVLAIPSKSAGAAASRSARASVRFGRSRAKNKTLAKFERKAGLRQTIAQAVQLRVSAAGGSMSIQVDAALLPDDQKSLPWDMEGAGKPWRHPVYGHDKWVQQQSHPYFFKTIEGQVPRVDAEVLVLMELFAKQAGF